MKKQKIVVAASLGFAQLALLTSGALSQETPATSLNEVVVTASRSPRKQSEIGRVVRVISSEQLSRSQGRTLPDVLNNVAGLTLSGTTNAPGSNVTVFTRGAARGNTLILIDGIAVNNASDVNGDYDISSIAIDQVERVEILRGANSTLYGSDAVAGVINIITKKPSLNKVAANVLATGGTYNTFKQAFGLNGSIGQTGLAVNFSNLTSDGFSMAADKTGTANFENDGFDQKAVSANARQQLTENFSVGANLQVNRNKFDLDGGSFIDDAQYSSKNTTLFGGVHAKYTMPGGALNFVLNQNNAWNSFYNPDGARYYSKLRNTGNISYAEVILNHKLFSFADITSGINYRHAKTNQAFESESQYGPYNSYLSGADANNNIFSTYTSVFFKADNFHLELGGRYNHHSKYGNNLTYTFNPSYVIAGRYKFFVSLASAFKAPSLYHLSSIYRNPNGLSPETTTSYEGGTDLEIIPGKINFSAAAFIRNSDDIIYFYTDPKTFASQYRNGNQQKDKGFELELNTNLLQKLSFNAWYAYVKGRGIDVNGAEADYLLRRPKSSYGANVGYQFGKAVSFNIIYKYTGSRLDPFYNSALFKTVNLEQKAFSLVDVYLQTRPSSAITLFADIKNVFDKKYTEWEGYSTRGRNFNAGIKYDIK